MDENCLAYGIEISDSDWEKTPANVKELVEKMGQYIKKSAEKLAELEAKHQELLEKINRTSKNSSSPPSSDPLHAEKKPEKNQSDKKRGGQPGHKGHSRFLYELSECESVLDHHPLTCKCCGEKLRGQDANPYRHQIVEIPPINPIIIYAAYNWVNLEQRQLCWAHLRREFIKISERPGVSTKEVMLW